MAQKEAAKSFARQVKPLLSLDYAESQRRVRSLYKAWYRQVPIIGQYYQQLKYHNARPIQAGNNYTKSGVTEVNYKKAGFIGLELQK